VGKEIEIIRKIIGPILPHGESNYDAKVLENIDRHKEVEKG